MYNVKRILIICMTVVLLCASLCVTASAIELPDENRFQVRLVDGDGNVEILIDFDKSVLISTDFDDYFLAPDIQIPSVYAYPSNATSALPNPNRVAQKVAGLDELALDQNLPNCSNFILIDYGPNWIAASNANTGNTPITGRYAYVYWGMWDAEAGTVTSQVDRNPPENSYSHDATVSPAYTVFQGPVAYVSYNDSDGNLTVNSNTYSWDIGKRASELELYGLQMDANENEFNGEAANVVTFSMRGLDSFWLGMSQACYNDIYDFTWDENWSGDVGTGGIAGDSIWDYLTNGYFEDSDNPVIQAFAKVLQGLAEVVTFIQDVPDFIAETFGILPENFVAFLEVCLAAIFTVILIKFALHVLR